jgi:protein gp37
MTTIQWTDVSWNPVTGCSKVSQGCRNCYAEQLAPRVFAGQTVRERISPIVDESSYKTRLRRFTDVRCHEDRLDKPLSWRKPRTVSVNSMGDLFHEDVPKEFILDVFAVMALANTHTFQVLTKRPQRMHELLSDMDGTRLLMHADCERTARWGQDSLLSRWSHARRMTSDVDPWPLPNVWLGVSVEDQATADERIPILLDTPAAVRFVSCEPLLGPVDLCDIVTTEGCAELHRDALYCDVNPADDAGWWGRTLDWVLVGGESGPKARPCDVGWIRSIVQQCKTAGVPCFVKQLGFVPYVDGVQMRVWSPDSRGRSRVTWPKSKKGGDPSEWPEDLRVREYPGQHNAAPQPEEKG